MDGRVGKALWHRWSPANARNIAYADIARGVAAFEPLDLRAGRAAAAWLKNEALANHPATLTYVLVRDGLVEGFFAICSSAVTLKESHRRELAAVHESHAFASTQGASMLVWLAKHREARSPGEEILDYAISIALDVAKRQGTLTFVIDPFDEQTAQMLMDRYGFKRSRTEVREGLCRLWAPLYPEV